MCETCSTLQKLSPEEQGNMIFQHIMEKALIGKGMDPEKMAEHLRVHESDLWEWVDGTIVPPVETILDALEYIDKLSPNLI